MSFWVILNEDLYQINTSEKVVLKLSYGCLMIKPDAYNRGIVADVRQDMLLMCKWHCLEIKGESTRVLTIEETYQIYPNIGKKSFLQDFLSLMTSNHSTAFMLFGKNAIESSKLIRGVQRTDKHDRMLGIRGKYCYIVNISPHDFKELETSCRRSEERLIEAIIGGVIHAADTAEEVIAISKIFKIPLGEQKKNKTGA